MTPTSRVHFEPVEGAAALFTPAFTEFLTALHDRLHARALTLRTAMERPEAMDSGHIVLTGLEPDTILRAIRFVTGNRDADRQQPIADEYEIRNTSTRVLKLILGTARLSHAWDGIVAESRPIAALYEASVL